jgi:hypothetical protein
MLFSLGNNFNCGSARAASVAHYELLFMVQKYYFHRIRYRCLIDVSLKNNIFVVEMIENLYTHVLEHQDHKPSDMRVFSAWIKMVDSDRFFWDDVFLLGYEVIASNYCTQWVITHCRILTAKRALLEAARVFYDQLFSEKRPFVRRSTTLYKDRGINRRKSGEKNKGSSAINIRKDTGRWRKANECTCTGGFDALRSYARGRFDVNSKRRL